MSSGLHQAFFDGRLRAWIQMTAEQAGRGRVFAGINAWLHELRCPRSGFLVVPLFVPDL